MKREQKLKNGETETWAEMEEIKAQWGEAHSLVQLELEGDKESWQMAMEKEARPDH